MHHLLRINLITFLVIVCTYAQAQTRYWVAGTTANWSGDNWSSTSGGAADGSGPPTALQSAQFDANGLGNCTVDVANPSISGLVVNGYTATIDLNGNTLTSSGTVTLSSGTINDTPGTDSLVISSTGNAVFSGTTFGAIVNGTAANLSLNGSTFNAKATLTKNGASTNTSTGGNRFAANAILNNAGSGELRLGNVQPDTFDLDLTINNTGTSTIYFAINSANNLVSGNLDVNNTATGTNNYIYLSNGSAASLTVNGNVSLSNTATASNSRIILGNVGDVSIGGTFTATNSPSGAQGYIYVANSNGSVVDISGNSTVTNSQAGTTKRVYLGSGGNVNFGGTLDITNSSSATNSQVFLQNGSTSTNTYSENITISTTDAASDGILFGNGGGSGTLASGRTITIGGGGFVAGSLYLRNFAQSGATAQSLAPTGTTTLTLYDCNWGGNVTFSAPRINSRGTSYSGTADLTKNGATNDASAGGNRFAGNATFTNTGSGYFMMGNGSPDTCDLDVSIINSGTNSFYWGNSGANNVISGNLDITNSATGTTNYIYICNNVASSLNIGGNVNITNSGTASDCRTFLGNNGDVDISGTLTANNSASGAAGYIQIANGANSAVSVSGVTTITNGGTGTTKRTYLGNNGSITFNDALSITNNSTANNSEVYLNAASNSSNVYNGNISLTAASSSCDGILFGSSGGSGSLAATRTVAISGSYSAIQLYFRNFTQNGATAQTLSPTGTTLFTVYDCNWGGDVNFSAPQFITRGSTYSGTASIAKTGASNNNSVGGNNFASTLSLTNSGSGQLLFGSSSPDTVGGDFTITNSGSNNIHLGYASANNVFDGNIILNSSGSSGGIYFGNNGGTSTLAATRTVSIGGSGFSSGTLTFRGFTQTGATAQSLTLTGTATLTLYDAAWGGDVVFAAPRISTRGTTYSGTAELSKTGGSNDSSVGGNLFSSNTTLNHSGSGQWTMGNGNADTFSANLSVNMSGSSRMYIATNSAGNTIAGTLDITNSSTSASAAYVYVSSNAASTLTISGQTTLTNSGSGSDVRILFGDQGDITLNNNLIINNTSSGVGNVIIGNNLNSLVAISGNVTANNSGSGTTNQLYIGNNGDITIGGTLDMTNSSSATTANYYVASGANSAVTISGNSTLTNSGSGTTSRSYLGNSGSVTFDGTLSISNSSAATNSQVYCNNASSSSNAYNQNITLEVTNANSDGIIFGNSDGNGTLASGRTISIGGGGFIAGALYFRNFTQVGATAQTLLATGTTIMTLYDSNWGGDVNFSSPRIITRGTSYSGTATLSKTGSTDDTSAGGNSFTGNTTLNNSGSGFIRMGNGTADTFSANLTINNSGSRHIYLAYNSAGNAVAGDLSVTNSGTGSSYVYLSDATASTLTVNGNTTLLNNGSGTDCRIYLGNTGDVTLNGTLDASNTASGTAGYLYIATNNGSVVTIAGNTTITNSGAGTTKRSYLGNNGSITFNGTLSISNSSSATNSQVYCQNGSTSSNTYNQNITLEVTHADCDGIFFGLSTGSGTLASGRTISIGGGGYIAGGLYLRNFTQLGATAQTLQPTGTTTFTSYDCNWGGDVVFSASRMVVQGSTFSGTASLEKTGASDDNSTGGNTFNGNVTLTNSGSGYWRFGSGTLDAFNANVDIVNSGSRHFYLAYSGAGHAITGDLNVTNSGTGTSYVYIASASTSSLNVGGNATFTNNGNGTDCRIYIGDQGDITFSGTVDIENSASGTNSYIYVANNANSTVSISGNTTANHSGSGTTKRFYLGNSGDISFGGTLTITNSSSANNSQFYCNNGSTSANTYSNNITLSCTDASSDGILFGSGGGTGTLASGRTVSIGGSGYIAGSLYFRNFTQTGATAQSLAPTGTTTLTNYDSNWGGDVNFSSPRHYTRGTTYSGTATLTKTGASDDASVGGNAFSGDVILTNSSSGYFLMGNGTADTYSSNLTLNNSGSRHIYIAHNSAGNSIGGNLIVNNNGTGASYIYISTATNSTLSIGGATTINNSGSGSSCRVYFGDSGDITAAGDVTVDNSTSGTQGLIYMANSTNALVTINGNTSITNGGSTTTNRIYLGNNGDMTFNGTLDLTNNSTSANSQIYCNVTGNSNNNYNGNISLVNSTASSDGIYFGSSGGSGTLSTGNTISIGGGGFIASTLYLRNFTQNGATAQNITLTGTATATIYDCSWAGNLSISAPRLTSRGSTYSSAVSLSKTGASNDASVGGNVFNDEVTFSNSGTGYFMQANGTADDYNGDVNYIKTSTGLLYPAYNATCTYAGNINLNLNTNVTFGAAGNGVMQLDGTTAQSINDLAATAEPIFRRFVLDNANDEITLNTPVTVSAVMTFTQGNIITTETNLLTINDNVTVSGASDNSYVRGPIEKIGNDAFTFPVGDSGLYRPIAISAPSSTTAAFRATYFEVNPDSAGWTRSAMEGTLDHVSANEYWILDRISSSNSVTVTLSWDSNSGIVDNLSDIYVARWGSGQWNNEWNGGTTGNTSEGTVVSNAAITSFSPFTLSSGTINNPLPIELIEFNASLIQEAVLLNWSTASEINNDYFTIERSVDGLVFEPILTVDGAGNSSERLDYMAIDENPVPGTSYYRLKQTDFDGSFDYSEIAVIQNKTMPIAQLSVYPNPVRDNQFKVTLPKTSTNVRAVLSNLQGQIVDQQEFSSIESGGLLSIRPSRTLGSGCYLLQLFDQSQLLGRAKIIVD